MKKRMKKALLGRTNIINGASKNKEILFLCLLFVIGVILGSGMIKNNDNNTILQIKELFSTYIKTKNTQSIFQNFYTSVIFSSLPYFFLAFLGGLCAIGVSGILLMPLLKGISLGVVCGYLYSEYALKGVEYCLLIVFPCSVLCVATLILACKESIYMSRDVLNLLRKQKEIKENSSIKLYCARYAVLTFLLMFSSIVETISITAFSRFFTF